MDFVFTGCYIHSIGIRTYNLRFQHGGSTVIKYFNKALFEIPL